MKSKQYRISYSDDQDDSDPYGPDLVTGPAAGTRARARARTQQIHLPRNVETSILAPVDDIVEDNPGVYTSSARD